MGILRGQMGPSRLYGDSREIWEGEGEEKREKPPFSFQNLGKFCQKPDFRVPPTQRIFSDWSRAQEPQNWQISSNFLVFFSLFSSKKAWKKYEKLTFSIYFLKAKPWDPSKKLDLAICYTEQKKKEQLCTI